MRAMRHVFVSLLATAMATGPCVAQAAQATRPATRQATRPATTRALGHLDVTIVQVVGLVQVRRHDDDPWARAQVGMRLDEGAEFRTGPRSRVIFTIPPDQKITLDRLGVVKVLQAIRDAGVVRTDLGMKYGRTVYEVQEPGTKHDATIRTPGMTLAVRGTEYMSVFDHGPFAPVAIANQPVRATRDRGKATAFGKAGQRARLRADKESPGETLLDEGAIDPAGKFSGRSGDENALLAYLNQVSPGLDTDRFPLLRTLTDPNFRGSGVGTLPIPGQLEFTLLWSSASASNLDLIIRSPLGEILSPANLTVPSSGRHNGDGRAGEKSFGQEAAVWEQGYPRGDYTVTALWRSGGASNATFQVKRDPQTAGEILALVQGTVSAKKPRLVRTVSVNPPASTKASAKAKR